MKAEFYYEHDIHKNTQKGTKRKLTMLLQLIRCIFFFKSLSYTIKNP